MRTALAAAAVLLLTAGCVSSKQGPPPFTPLPTLTTPAGGIGQVVTPATTGLPASQASLGGTIHQGALTVTVTGPVTTEKDGAGLLATFHVTMANTSTAGDVVGPDSFGIRCDANRDDRNPGDEMFTSTVGGDKHIAAGKTLTGVAVVAWLKWDSTVKCTGATTIEARFLEGGFLSWTLPADVVAKVNAAAG